ncbi:MAG: hypothetical protein II372_01090, partial [Clostridia bacterium]|nr:hypothetical protein [Clostridia bacterium]
MKKRSKNRAALKSAFVIFFCFILFFGGSYAYLWSNLKETEKSADTKDYNVPYSSVPADCGLLINAPLNQKWLIYLDFTETVCTVISCDDIKQDAKMHLGYSIDYTITLDYDIIAGIIDRIGGIELESNGELLR